MGHLWCPTKSCRRLGGPRCDVCELVDSFAKGLADRAVADERERCAKIAEDFKKLGGNQYSDTRSDGIAAAIRKDTYQMLDDKRLAEIEEQASEVGAVWVAQRGTAMMVLELVAEVRRLRAALRSAREGVGLRCDFIDGARCNQVDRDPRDVCVQCEIGRALGEA